MYCNSFALIKKHNNFYYYAGTIYYYGKIMRWCVFNNVLKFTLIYTQVQNY